MNDTNNLDNWKPGRFVKFTGCIKSQVKFGSNDDPNEDLILGARYEIERFEIHSWHSKVYLKQFPNKKYNSVCFELCPIS